MSYLEEMKTNDHIIKYFTVFNTNMPFLRPTMLMEDVIY